MGLQCAYPSAVLVKRVVVQPIEVRLLCTDVEVINEELGQLLCVVAFTRHGDRTPKQKLKFRTQEPLVLAMMREHGRTGHDELKVKSTALMEDLLGRIEKIVERMQKEQQAASGETNDDSVRRSSEPKSDAETLQNFTAVIQVLKAHPFHGINRKVQLKPIAWKPCGRATSHCASPSELESSRWSGNVDSIGEGGARRMNASLPLSPLRFSEPTAAKAARGGEASSELLEVAEVQFVLKWGGELTSLGEAQATILGTRCRNLLYPSEQEGMLRLHASYRHDLKIYTSDEGRVQMTAAAFAKGFLDLEGQLTPILASLVSQNSSITRMLDETPAEGKSLMSTAKEAIHTLLTSEDGKPLTCGGALSPAPLREISFRLQMLCRRSRVLAIMKAARGR